MLVSKFWRILNRSGVRLFFVFYMLFFSQGQQFYIIPIFSTDMYTERCKNSLSVAFEIKVDKNIDKHGSRCWKGWEQDTRLGW